ncbi:MAG: hypothetical protein KIT84_18630 [Labilithrix sp.]|nr:hypothetical protein [Labilithrix sp.]MCW5813050.1 hypothetical protein [Labilithrix sp.]
MTVRLSVLRRGTQVEIEGPEAFVTSTFESLRDLFDKPNVKDDSADEPPTNDGEKAGEEGSRVSLKTFLEQKKPQNSYEAIACVLYHHQKFREQSELNSDEIRKALLQGRVKPPGNMTQTLTDCRRRYAYIEPGTKKGLWKLSHDGEVTVDLDLPREK